MEFWEMLGMPKNSSTTGAEIDGIIFWMHVMMAVLFVGWGLYFVVALVRHRGSRSPKADYHGTRTHVSSWIEGAVVVAEVIFLVGLSIPIWNARISYPDELEDPIDIRVTGEQFAWTFHYPGPDGKYGPTSNANIMAGINPTGLDYDHPDSADDLIGINTIFLVKDKPVRMQIASKDVIHSFFIPTMRVKTDAIPGQHSSLWFTPAATESPPLDENGAPLANVACAQLCGVQHSVMKGYMTVTDPDGFAKWYADQFQFRGAEPPPLDTIRRWATPEPPQQARRRKK